VLGIVSTIALIAGPLLGAVFSGDLSWRWIFYTTIESRGCGRSLDAPRPARSHSGSAEILDDPVASHGHRSSSGVVIARTGHYQIYPVIGAILTGGSMWGLSLANQTTGALNFFKSVGGAFGAAIFGAILAHELASRHSVHAYREVFAWTIPVMSFP
jgi:hypothetical protein